MNILINFRYLTGIKSNPHVIRQINDSYEMKFLISDFKNLAYKYKDQEISLNDIRKDKTILEGIKLDLIKIINSNIDDFNSIFDYDFYLWLDEICSVLVIGNKAIPLENKNEYVSFSDIKATVAQAVNEIANRSESFELNKYKDLMVVVYIDIIEKETPFLYLGSD